jgi:hypothetical protein
MLENINTYNEDTFRESFSKTEIYKKLLEDADYISWKKNYQEYESTIEFTPRWIVSSRIFSLASFYYLNFITQRANNDTIYDIGCGHNWFKKYLTDSNIIGMDQKPNSKRLLFADREEVFDDDWLKNRSNQFNYAFSINALHFFPISKIKERVVDFINVVKPGGVGYLTLNADCLIHAESADKLVELFGKTDPSSDVVEKYVRENLSDLKNHVTEFLCVDIDLTHLNEWMDGNIRLLFQK